MGCEDRQDSVSTGQRRAPTAGRTTLSQVLTSLAALGLILTIAGCGQKGPLTLPPPASAASAASVKAGSTPAAAPAAGAMNAQAPATPAARPATGSGASAPTR
ncbi:MAG: LPS translocon maturation chaperone LptM [Rubrivivax sp.]